MSTIVCVQSGMYRGRRRGGVQVHSYRNENAARSSGSLKRFNDSSAVGVNVGLYRSIAEKHGARRRRYGQRSNVGTTILSGDC